MNTLKFFSKFYCSLTVSRLSIPLVSVVLSLLTLTSLLRVEVLAGTEPEKGSKKNVGLPEPQQIGRKIQIGSDEDYVFAQVKARQNKNPAQASTATGNQCQGFTLCFQQSSKGLGQFKEENLNGLNSTSPIRTMIGNCLSKWPCLEERKKYCEAFMTHPDFQQLCISWKI